METTNPLDKLMGVFFIQSFRPLRPRAWFDIQHYFNLNFRILGSRTRCEAAVNLHHDSSLHKSQWRHVLYEPLAVDFALRQLIFKNLWIVAATLAHRWSAFQ